MYFHDQDGTLDDSALVGCQIMLQLYNPVTATWEIRWRGHVDQIDRTIVDTPGAPLADTAIQCVGIFDYLGGVKFLPGHAWRHRRSAAGGDDRGGVLRGRDASTTGSSRCSTTPDIVSTMSVVFTGNVDVNETLYDPDDVILQAVRDAADAEWPGVANFYEDRFGRAVFHGRFARFDPEGTGRSRGELGLQLVVGRDPRRLHPLRSGSSRTTSPRSGSSTRTWRGRRKTNWAWPSTAT